jgi:hypothetical protein
MTSDFGYVDLLNYGSAPYQAGGQYFDNASYVAPSCGGSGGGGGGGGGGDGGGGEGDEPDGSRRLKWIDEENLRLVKSTFV